MILLVIFKNDLIIKPYHLYLASKANPKQLKVVFEKDTYQQLKLLQQEVLEGGKPQKKHRKYFDVKIIYNNDTLLAKARLKGDHLDHYKFNPPSFRIKVKDGEILNTNKFSLQDLSTRGYLQEWCFLNFLKYKDVLAVNMDVIQLNLNGVNKIVGFEEHFTDNLLFRFKRKKGPIIAISEELFWNNGVLNDSIKYTGVDIYNKSELKVFNAPENDSISIRAFYLLDEFRNGNLKVSDVFDVDKLSYYFAITDLTNTHHAIRWHNNKFYYNSENDKLELIGFDGNSWKPTDSFLFEDQKLDIDILQLYKKDKDFLIKYLEQLKIVSEDKFLDNFYKDNENELKELISIIYIDNQFFKLNYKEFYKNAEWIRNNIEDYENRILE